MSEPVINENLMSNRAQMANNISNENGSSSNIFAANALSAAGAAFLSAVIVNPLDVAKIRLQAQAAGALYAYPLSNAMSRMTFCGPTMMFADLRCSPMCAWAGIQGTVTVCPHDCVHYKGTVDVLYKIARQEGVTRLWRGTNTGLALAIPMAFKETGKKPPGVLKTLIGILSNSKSTTSFQSKLQNFRFLWTGLGAQLVHDVPYSAICWATLEPTRRKLNTIMGIEASAFAVLGSSFTAGFVAGSLAAGATCPLDVVRTRRQIEKNPLKAIRMTTRHTLIEIWRDGGMKGLFAAAGLRVARAGPSVGIVVSFYEVVKYVLNTRFSPS